MAHRGALGSRHLRPYTLKNFPTRVTAARYTTLRPREMAISTWSRAESAGAGLNLEAKYLSSRSRAQIYTKCGCDVSLVRRDDRFDEMTRVSFHLLELRIGEVCWWCR